MDRFRVVCRRVESRSVHGRRTNRRISHRGDPRATLAASANSQGSFEGFAACEAARREPEGPFEGSKSELRTFEIEEPAEAENEHQSIEVANEERESASREKEKRSEQEPEQESESGYE